MREILFKAKRKSDGVWFEGMLTKTTVETPSETKVIYKIDEHNCGFSDESTFEPTYISGFSEEVDENTICQFTGVCDINGKKIWENDIIFDTFYETLGVVKFGMGTFDSGFYRYCGWHYESDGDVDHHALYKYYGKAGIVDFEVLGNIFDNPELLTAERIGENEN